MLLLISFGHKHCESSDNKNSISRKANEMLETAQILYNGVITGRIDRNSATVWVEENAMVGILCSSEIAYLKMDANFRESLMNLCQQLVQGNHIEVNTVTNLNNTVTHLLGNVDFDLMIDELKQKISKSKFLGDKIKENLNKLLAHFNLALRTFLSVKQKTVTAASNAIASDGSMANERRQKRMNNNNNRNNWFRQRLSLTLLNMHNQSAGGSDDIGGWPAWVKCAFHALVCAMLLLAMIYMERHLGAALFDSVANVLLLIIILCYFIFCMVLYMKYCNEERMTRSDADQQLLA
ncbi:hypothetical protein niasHS_009675 [Heterodera schachtii]|uniref:Uncharacterized protein n=1 Tax=Heterodera schachtii TaxID=97005 RepID=A0ABD2J0U8_HETSC